MSEYTPMTRTEGWLRALLWLLPLAVMGFGGRLPSRLHLWTGQTIDRARLLIVSTLLLTVAAGWIWGAFKAESPKRPYARRAWEITLWALWFCVMQALIVPTVIGAVAMATCALMVPSR